MCRRRNVLYDLISENIGTLLNVNKNEMQESANQINQYLIHNETINVENRFN